MAGTIKHGASDTDKDLAWACVIFDACVFGPLCLVISYVSSRRKPILFLLINGSQVGGRLGVGKDTLRGDLSAGRPEAGLG